MRFTSIRQVCFRNVTQIHIYCARKTRTRTQPVNVQIPEIYSTLFVLYSFHAILSAIDKIRYICISSGSPVAVTSFFCLCLNHIVVFSPSSILYSCIPRNPHIVIIFAIKQTSIASSLRIIQHKCIMHK